MFYIIINIILLINSTSAAAADQETTPCYNVAGNIITSRVVLPCDNTAAVSHCCSRDDLCLGNGLCLNNAGDGRVTAQGCTDRDWHAPCRNDVLESECIYSDADYVSLWMCRSKYAIVELCCNDDDARCCEAGLTGNTSARMFSLQVWGGVWIPGQKRPSATGTVDTGSSSSGEGTSGQESKQPEEQGIGSADRITIAMSVVFGVLGVGIGWAQLRYVARESKRRGQPVSGFSGMGTLLARQFRLWFRGGTVKEFGDVRYPEEVAELADTSPTP